MASKRQQEIDKKIQEGNKRFGTPGLSAREKQLRAAQDEQFDVDRAAGTLFGRVPGMHSRSNIAASKKAEARTQVAQNAYDRQKKEALRRYNKGSK